MASSSWSTGRFAPRPTDFPCFTDWPCSQGSYSVQQVVVKELIYVFLEELTHAARGRCSYAASPRLPRGRGLSTSGHVNKYACVGIQEFVNALIQGLVNALIQEWAVIEELIHVEELINTARGRCSHTASGRT